MVVGCAWLACCPSRSVSGSVGWEAGDGSATATVVATNNCLLLHLGDGVLRLREGSDAANSDAGPMREEALPPGKLMASASLQCDSAAVAEDVKLWLQSHVDDYNRGAAEDDRQLRKLVLAK